MDLKKLIRDGKNDDAALLKRLREVDFFVLDNSLRETTVGAVRGHTLEDKKAIIRALSKTNLTEMVLGSFGASDNVDDLAAHWLNNSQWQHKLESMWGFSELYDMDPLTKLPSMQPPYGLVEMATVHNMSNAIIEIDTCNPKIDYSKIDLIKILRNQLEYVDKNFRKRSNDKLKPRVLVNLRDFTDYETHPDGFERALQLVEMMAEMHATHGANCPFGLMLEEPTGFLLPETISKNVRTIRKVMGKWPGKLLLHTHMNFGLAQAGILQAIGAGVDGIWGAVCRTGAHLGHACSAVTLLNLARLGNTWVRERYNIPEIVKAARAVHEIVVGSPPNALEEVYGINAFDVAFHGWHGFMQGEMDAAAAFAGVTNPTIRIGDFAGAAMIEQAMVSRFGSAKVGKWDPALCVKMEKTIDNELLRGTCYDFNTIIGLAQLYEFSGGHLTPAMLRAMDLATKDSAPDLHPLLVELKRRWWAKASGKPTSGGVVDIWQSSWMAKTDPPKLSLDVFLDDILQAKQGVLMQKNRADFKRMLDVDHDGSVSWAEFEFRVKWGMSQRGLLFHPTPEALMLDAFGGVMKELRDAG
jgi:hypothetical protein